MTSPLIRRELYLYSAMKSYKAEVGMKTALPPVIIQLNKVAAGEKTASIHSF